MPIDPSASTVATSALQAIPFSSLIGGPLDACISAQAKAARTTWEFIQAVGLNTDKNGQKSAINVTFSYQKDGAQVNLVVPLLTIVPIPYIAVQDISIDFKANISAESSSVQTDTSSTSMGGSATVGGQVGWGPFSAKFDMNANYSSKKDSTATQQSKYSVEYTMDVAVKAGQDAMPAGLATVLNILQSSITTASPRGNLSLSGNRFQLDANNPTTTVIVRATVKDGQGALAAGIPVTFALDAASNLGMANGTNNANNGTLVVNTGDDGTAFVTLSVPAANAASFTAEKTVPLSCSAKVNGTSPLTGNAVVMVAPKAP